MRGRARMRAGPRRTRHPPMGRHPPPARRRLAAPVPGPGPVLPRDRLHGDPLLRPGRRPGPGLPRRPRRFPSPPAAAPSHMHTPADPPRGPGTPLHSVGGGTGGSAYRSGWGVLCMWLCGWAGVGARACVPVYVCASVARTPGPKNQGGRWPADWRPARP